MGNLLFVLFRPMDPQFFMSISLTMMQQSNTLKVAFFQNVTPGPSKLEKVVHPGSGPRGHLPGSPILTVQALRLSNLQKKVPKTMLCTINLKK